jgi:hypothetical protein
MLAALLATYALAHPFQTTVWSLRTSAKVDDEQLIVISALEIPTGVVLGELARRTQAAGGKFNRAKLEAANDAYNDETWLAMGAAISVTLNGQPSALTFQPVDSPVNGRASDAFFLYLVEARHPLPKGTPTLEVAIDNRAWPDQEMFYSTSAHAGQAWGLVSASDRQGRLGECQPDGDDPEDLVDDDGRPWTRDPAARTLQMTVRRR